MFHGLGNFPGVEVGLVEDYGRRDPVNFTGDQDAVQEWQFDLRKEQGDNDICHVDVGCDHMGLPREVGRSPHQVVLPVEHFDDRGGILYGRVLVVTVPDLVSYSHGIGGFGVPEPHLAFEEGGEGLPKRQLGKQEMASRVLDYRRCSFDLCAHTS